MKTETLRKANVIDSSKEDQITVKITSIKENQRSESTNGVSMKLENESKLFL